MPMKRQPIRTLNGVVEKRCSKCREWRRYPGDYYRDGRKGRGPYRVECKRCSNDPGYRNRKVDRGVNHGYVPISEIKVWLTFTVGRIGGAELSRRIGVNHSHLWRIQHRQRYVTKSMAAAILAVAYEVNKSREKRTRKEIAHGTGVRSKADGTDSG